MQYRGIPIPILEDTSIEAYTRMINGLFLLYREA